MNLKTSKRKYPKTFHVPWSGGIQSDDKVFKSMSHFHGKMIVVTEKKDGENTTISNQFLHARSLDSTTNWTRAWVTKMHSVLKFDIPDGIKLVGENLFAEHAIRYPDEHLEGYFYLLSVWQDIDGSDDDYCLSFSDTVDYADLLDLPMPKVLYRGIYDEQKLIELSKKLDLDKTEGYVIRLEDGFFRSQFKSSVAKFVRKDHVQDNSEHWLVNAVQNGRLSHIVKPSFMSGSK